MKKQLLDRIRKKRLTKIIYTANDKSNRVVSVYSFKKHKDVVKGRNIDNDKQFVIPLDSVLDVVPLVTARKSKALREKTDKAR